MKLYQSQLSPFASRCRIVIYAKGLQDQVLLEDINSGRHLNPTAKSPFLLTNDGVICESTAICEFLEEAFPQDPLMPQDTFARGQVRSASLAIEHYIFPSIRVLSRLNSEASVESAELEGVYKELEKWESVPVEIMELSRGAHDHYAIGASLTMLDCILVPAYFLREAFTEHLPCKPQQQPVLASYWQRIGDNEYCRQVIGEMQDAILKRSTNR